MTPGWAVGKFAQLARVRSGFAFKSSQWTDAGVPVVKIGNVKRGRLDMEGCSFVTEDDAMRSGFLLSDGDILIGLTGYVGEVAKVRNLGPLVLNQRVGKFYPTRDCDPEFLFFLVSNDEFRQRVEAASHGSAQANVSPSAIEAFEVLIPPLTEQRSIAATLGALDDKIELNRKMNATLEAMVRALFRDWFVDFGPTRAKMAGNAPYLSPDLWSLFPDRLDAEGMPEGWAVGTLGAVATARNEGVDPSAISPETPYIGLEHMPRGSIALTDWEGAGKVSSNKASFVAGDFLFGKLRPYFHKVGIAPVSGICSTDIVVVRPKSAKWSGFVIACISDEDFVAYTDKTSTGTKMPRTSWSIMAKYPVALPPADLADAYNAIVAPMVDRIRANIHESRTLAQTRDLLLPRLMSGELRVAEAERVVEAAL